MEIYFVLGAVLYLFLGFGFSKVMKEVEPDVPSFVNLIIWPAALIVIAINPQYD